MFNQKAAFPGGQSIFWHLGGEDYFSCHATNSADDLGLFQHPFPSALEETPHHQPSVPNEKGTL